MIITDFDTDRIHAALNAFISKKRFCANSGQKVCLSYSLSDRDITIYENRSDPYDSKTIKAFPIVTVHYLESVDSWEVVIASEDLEWHAYEPEKDLTVSNIGKALEMMNEKLKARYA